MLVIASALALTAEEEDALRMHISSDRLETLWLGEGCPLDCPVLPAENASEALWARLEEG